MFTLPNLPYAYDSLEPHIDAKTMEIHHTKHHQTYVDKLNAALKDQPEWLEKKVEDVLRDFNKLPESVKTAVKNHGGGHANHSLFWTILSPDSDLEPAGELSLAIDKKFGSFNSFSEEFKAAAAGHFGSGWTWLVLDGGELAIMTTPNQDSPYMAGKVPILGLDVWEHAYYLKYQNRRPEYIDSFFKIINWEEVGRRFDAAVA